MKVLLGIGNPLRNDDAAGSYVAQNFHHQYWVIIDGKTAPENFSSVIKKINPALLIIVDAAEIGIDPGDFRIIPDDRISELQLSTHSMPLHYFIEYLKPYCQEIVLIGIQPQNTQIGEIISQPVLSGCHALIQILLNNDVKKIQSYS